MKNAYEGPEMNFCRRCGGRLKNIRDHIFKCPKNHLLYANEAPAVGLILLNDKDEVLLVERAIEPGKGKLDIPGGFCMGFETFEQALERETEEEINLLPQDYTSPVFLTTGLDLYQYRGETLTVCAAIFIAKLRTTKKPQAQDDAKSIKFIQLNNINFDDIYFPAVKAGLTMAKERTHA